MKLMKLVWLRLAFFGPVLLALLEGVSELHIVRFHLPDPYWLLVALTFCAEVSAVLAVVGVVHARSALNAAIDLSFVLISLVAYASVGFVLFFFDPYNLWLAACSVGIVFAALVIAAGRELMQRRTRKPAVETGHGAFSWYRRLAPASAFLAAALASLPLALTVFAFIDHALWASLPSDPWRGGDVMSNEQATRNMILELAFPVCGSLFNLVTCGMLCVYHARIWRGETATIFLSGAVLFAAAAQADSVWGAAWKYLLQHSTWDIGYLFRALCDPGWVIVPTIFVFLLITQHWLVLKRA